MLRQTYDTVRNWPSSLRFSLAALGGGMAVGSVSFLHLDKFGWLILLGCLVGVALLVLAYVLILRWVRAMRARPFSQNLRTAAGHNPMAIAEPAQRAQLDSLRKTFESGVEKFESAGKDLYALPWYLIVGEPGSGKTEAVRHCNVGFPPGLQNQLQGVGGTINMGWWFTNHAVILDTAGRLLFQEVPAGSTTEWTEFLRLLVKSRPTCPINGLILVIPADSLILDTADKIESKAGKIAQQFDLIQRTLGVRFPVFVMITKCDLINGFREFFDGLSDIKLQHQILGWSNPNPLDSPFNPEEVDKHLATVRHRLLIRRYGLLLDPVAREGADARRADEVDALYSLPDRLMKIAPRLRRYLEMVFVPGEWSAKPLFLRGIYFTSSMREGAALDAELAETLNVPVNSLPEGRGWERERAYFLRDLFVKKIFVEKGLVTRASNTKQLQRFRRLALVGTGVGSALVLLLLTWYGSTQMNKGVRDQTRFWNEESAHLGDQLAIVGRGGNSAAGKPQFVSRVDTQVSPEVGSVGEMHARAVELLDRPIHVNWILRPAGHFLDSGEELMTRQRQAYRLLFASDVLIPTLTASRQKINAEVPSTWSDASTDALVQLIRFQNQSSEPDMAALLRYVLQPEDFAKLNPKYKSAFQMGLQNWLRAPREATAVKSEQTIAEGVQSFIDHWEWMRSPRNPTLEMFGSFREDAHAVITAGDDLAHFSGRLEINPPKTREQYKAAVKDWSNIRNRHHAAVQTMDAHLVTLTTQAGADRRPLARLYEDKIDEVQRDGRRDYQKLIEEYPGEGTGSWRNKLMDAAANFRRNDEADRKAIDDLTSLDKKLLPPAKCSDGGLRPLYAVLDLNADLVDASLPKLDADNAATRPASTPVTWTLLKPADKTLQDQMAQTAAKLVKPADDADAGDASGVKTCTAVLQHMTEPARRYQILSQALADAPTGAEALMGFVAKLSTQTDALNIPALPFVQFKTLDSSFYPAAAAEALSYGTLTERYVTADAGAAPAVLEAAVLNDAYRSTLQSASAQYLKKYVDYWSNAMLRPSISDGRRWSDVWQQLDTLRASDVDVKLIAVCKQVQAAFDAVGGVASGEQRKAIDAERDAVARGLDTANTVSSALASQNALRGWHQLGANARLASDGILGQPPGSFTKQCLVRTSTAQPRDVVNEYWDRVTFEFLRSLAADPDARPKGMQELQKFEKFPLASGGGELDPTDLSTVRALLDRMPAPPPTGSASANPVYSVREGGRLKDSEEINGELDHLCGTMTVRDHDKVVRLQKMIAALPASADSALRCRMSVPPETVQRRLKRDYSRVEGYAFDQYSNMAFTKGTQSIAPTDRISPWTTDQPTVLGDVRYPGEARAVALFVNPADTQPAALAPPPPQMKWWESLRWLRDNNAQRVDKEDASKWYVEFISDKQFSFWIELDFARPLPDLDLWK